MKSKMIKLLTGMTIVAMLSGCGVTEITKEIITTDKTAEATDSANVEQKDDSDTQTGAGSSTTETPGGKEYTYSETQYFDGDDPQAITYDHKYTLTISDDNTAKLVDSYIYSENNRSDSTYIGSVSEVPEGLEFSYISSSANASNENYIFYIENNKVVNVEYVYLDSELTDLVGTYSGEDEVLGKLTLTLSRSGQAKLSTDNGVTYSGSIMTINGKYDLMVSDEEEGSLDWYVTFDGSSFTHEEYSYDTYNAYAGEYKWVGELGTLDVTVDDTGTVQTTIRINGEDHKFSGSVYVNEEEKVLSGTYLSSEDGYSLDLTLVYLDDDQIWNYSGYLTSPLGAG